MQAICRFGRDAARRGHHGARRGTREGHHAPARGRRVVGCTNRGAPRARGHTLVGFDPWLVASPSAPAALGAATASTLPLGLRLHPSFIGRVGRARLASAPIGASDVIRLGAGMEGADANAPPP